jgi:hypothetical protein
MKSFGAFSIASGLLSAMFFSSRFAARDCIQCFTNIQDEKQEMALQVKKLLLKHHPRPNAFIPKSC